MTMRVFELKYPVDVKGVLTHKLEMRRPRVRDLKEFSKGVDADPIGAMEKAISSLTETPLAVIGDLDLVDFGPMKDAFEDFLNEMASASRASS